MADNSLDSQTPEQGQGLLQLVVNAEGGNATVEEPTYTVSTTADFAVKLRGLPYEATPNEILQFLSNINVVGGKSGVHVLQGADGRPSGEAIVRLATQADLDESVARNNQHIGRRYIEVAPIAKQEADWALQHQPGTEVLGQQAVPRDVLNSQQVVTSGDTIVRLRGLPYSATAQDIVWLLKDCKVADNEKGVHFTTGHDGRPSGEAFVELCGEDDVSKALGHNNEHMGKRYVEIFRATRGQFEYECHMADKVADGSGGVVRLRGLPFKVTEEEIRRFFSGMSIPTGGVVIQVDQDTGRCTGEGFAEFCNKEDAEKALSLDRQTIGHRYIEVFRSSSADIRPVAYKDAAGGPPSRGTPYDRPGRGGFGGGGGGGYGGYGAKFGSGYEHSARGRGRGGAMGGPPVAAGYPPYDPYRGYYGEEEYYPQAGQPYQETAYPGVAAPAGVPPVPGQDMVAYPALRTGQPAAVPNRGGGFVGGGGAGGSSKHIVRMRGLPFSAKDKDINDFFSPLVPSKLNMDFDHYGRPAGEADVHFATHEDAVAAMQKNNAHMGHRYIELFLNSSPDVGGVPSGGGALMGLPRPAGAAGLPPARGAPPVAAQRYPPQQQQAGGWTDQRPTQQGRDMTQAPQPAVYDAAAAAAATQQYSGYQGAPQQSYQGGAGGYPATGTAAAPPQQGYQQQQSGYTAPAQGAYAQQPQAQPQQQWY